MSHAANSPVQLSQEERLALLTQMLRRKADQSKAAYPLSHGQRSLWVAQRLSPDNAAYNEVLAFRIQSRVDVAALRRAFQTLMDRHPALRTTFRSVQGKPLQQIYGRMPVQFETVDASAWTSQEMDAHLTDAAHRPFSLERGPMMRVHLFTRSQTDHVLLLAVHHIATDLWSLSVLLDELSSLYAAEKTGAAAKLPPLQLRYIDFVHWQAKMLAGPEGERHRTYWHQQLAGDLPDLNLPTDRPRPSVQSHAGSAYSFAIGHELARRLRELACAEGATLYMTMLAAFQGLLHRYSGQEDFAVGSPMSGRRSEVKGVVGYFANPVVLRANLAGQPTFREFLARTRRTVLDGIEHQDYPFPLLVDELRPTRDPSRSPLFQVVFAWEKPHGLTEVPGAESQDGDALTRIRIGDLVLESTPVKQQATKFDLTLMIVETAGALSATLQYNTDLWDEQSITRMAGHFLTLLEGIVADPGQRVAELPLLTAAERRQMLVAWNETTVDFLKDKCAHELIEAQVEKTPDAPALKMGDECLTYRDLNERANRLAHYLRSLGVGPEVPVGLYTERSSATVVAILAILKAGGAYVPLDPAYPKDRLAYMLADAQVPVLLTQKRLAADLPTHQAAVVCLDADHDIIARHSSQNPQGGATVANLAYVIYTSGSTGLPKGVLVTHRGIGNLAQAQIKAFQVHPKSRVLQFASLCFDASVSEIVMALMAGGTLVLASQESLLPGPNLIGLLKNEAINVVTLPPSVLAAMPAEEFPELHTVVAAGEACSAEIVARWAPGRRFLNAYGPTENTVCATIAHCTDGSRRPTIGRPMDNVQVYILDAKQQPVPVGVPGELYIGGAGLARGYHNRPDLTAQKFIPHPLSPEPGARLYRTGDQARYLADGSIDFLGRLDQQVKIRGFRIELGEIEAVLGQHPAVRDTVVVAREDVPGDKRLVAYFVADMESAPTVSELRRFLKEKLPDHMVPSAFVRLDAFPLSPNGKVDRKALPAPDVSRPDLESAYVAPQTPAQAQLAEIWAQVLGLEKVGIHDNFFELGGASIQTLQVAEQANQLGLPLTPEAMFQFQTIAELDAAFGSAGGM